MILRGILDQSLGRYCIRGYASLENLEKISRADFTYQRNLIGKQKDTILKFLESPDIFFPEVILSFTMPNDTRRGRRQDNPIESIITKNSYRNSKIGISMYVRSNKFKSGSVSETVNLVSINIDDSTLLTLMEANNQPFQRIDGNHRLSAAKQFNDRTTIKDLKTPFCIVLLSELTPEIKQQSLKFEKTIFHNINSKSVPLTHEEIFRVIIDDDVNFLNAEILSREDFGPDYYFTRNIWQKIKPERYPAIANLIYNKKDDISFIRTILVNFFRLLREYGIINKQFKQFALIERTFRKVEQRYEDYILLKQSKAQGLLEAFLYFTFKDNKFNLDWFTDWVLENHIYELKQVSANDLIAIFEKILLSKHRTVFISMQFNDAVCENHFEFIKTLIIEINTETKANIKIYPLRIDRFKNGSAYKIPDAILNRIADSGLLIADLTKNNPNVYHEVGYLMGLFKLRKQRKLNLIMICNTTHTPYEKIGFNIRNHKVLGFADTHALKDSLKEEIKNFYFKNG